MKFVRVNDVLLHYRLHGRSDAPALVLVNSLGTDARIWDAVIERLAPQYRILSYDKRGHGLSDAPPGDYSLDQHVGDLAGLVAHCGLDRFALMGVSVGGLIAQGYALAHPEQVTSLVLCDTAAKLGDAASWDGRIRTIRDQGMGALADAVMERWFPPAFRTGRPDELAGWRNLFLRSSPDGYCGTCATLRDSDLRDRIGGLAMPTLVVVGSEDASTPVAVVRDCAAAIPGARFEIIEGAGHIPSIDQPDRLTAVVQGFLKGGGHG
jgi:3-oxoadipate enol-lactonase